MSEQDARRLFLELPDDMRESEVVDWVAAGEDAGIVAEPADSALPLELEFVR